MVYYQTGLVSILVYPKAVAWDLLFVIYSSKLLNTVDKHLSNVHAYADDTQLFLAFKPGNHANETAAVPSIQSCIRDLQNWMLIDRLKINPDKAEFLILGTRQQLEKVITSHLVVGESGICPSTKVKNFGSWLQFVFLLSLQHT